MNRPATTLRTALIASLALLSMSPAPADGVKLVSVARFADLAEPRQLEFPATVVALRQVEIAAETSGRVTGFSLEPGDRVERGDTLLRIDCTRSEIEQTRAEAGLKRLQAQRDLTEQQLERARGLVQSRSISRDELDQRETQLNADIASIEEQQASLRLARRAVRDCELKAPFSGVIVDKLSHAGGYATPGKPMLVLMQTDAIEVHLELPSAYLDDLEQATGLQFVDGQQAYRVELRSLLPVTNPASLMRQARLRLVDERLPAAGNRGVIRFDSADLFLPASVVVQRDGRYGVFIVQQDRAGLVELDGAREGIEVAASLPADSLIVTGPLVGIADQDRIDPR
jgi:RND family efflux transporter MFP subunit